jgi:hypothetical protein
VLIVRLPAPSGSRSERALAIFYRFTVEER